MTPSDDSRLRRALGEIEELTRTAGVGATETAIPRVSMVRGAVPRPRLAALYRPMIGFVVQGRKDLSIGRHEVVLEAPSYFLLPTHVPATGRVRPGRGGAPYVSVGLGLSQSAIRSLLRDLPDERVAGVSRETVAVPADADFSEAWLRMLGLLRSPSDVPALAPAYEREILFRVLTGPQGALLRELGLRGSGLSRIAESVTWLREHFAQPIEIRELAEHAAMAVTTFHRRFKETTGMSPVQFQKQLRLLEARRLIAFGNRSVANAACEVGYESPSQFSREYSRFFGASPGRDAATLRRIENDRLE